MHACLEQDFVGPQVADAGQLLLRHQRTLDRAVGAADHFGEFTLRNFQRIRPETDAFDLFIRRIDHPHPSQLARAAKGQAAIAFEADEELGVIGRIIRRVERQQLARHPQVHADPPAALRACEDQLAVPVCFGELPADQAPALVVAGQLDIGDFIAKDRILYGTVQAPVLYTAAVGFGFGQFGHVR